MATAKAVRKAVKTQEDEVKSDNVVNIKTAGAAKKPKKVKPEVVAEVSTEPEAQALSAEVQPEPEVVPPEPAEAGPEAEAEAGPEAAEVAEAEPLPPLPELAELRARLAEAHGTAGPQTCIVVHGQPMTEPAALIWADWYASRVGTPMYVVDIKSGAVIRECEGRKGATVAAPLTVRKPYSKPGRSRPGSKGISAACAALLKREGGASKEELVAITDWSFGMAFLTRLAATNGCSLEIMGRDQWRFVPKT